MLLPSVFCEMKVRFHTDVIIEYYNIYDHNTAFSVAWKQEILQEIAAMVEENKRKEKMYYYLQYGLLDIKDDHVQLLKNVIEGRKCVLNTQCITALDNSIE
jgi:hypothetical protein